MNNTANKTSKKHEHGCIDCGAKPAHYRHFNKKYMCHRCYRIYVMKRVITTSAVATLLVAFIILYNSLTKDPATKPIKWTVEVKKIAEVTKK